MVTFQDIQIKCVFCSMNELFPDLVYEYQQYQDATADDDDEEEEGEPDQYDEDEN